MLFSDSTTEDTESTEETPDSSPSAPELDDVAAVAFRWPAFGQSFEFAHRLTFGCDFLAPLAALVAFTVESLRDCCWPPRFAEQQNFDLEVAAVVRDAQ